MIGDSGACGGQITKERKITVYCKPKHHRNWPPHTLQMHAPYYCQCLQSFKVHPTTVQFGFETSGSVGGDRAMTDVVVCVMWAVLVSCLDGCCQPQHVSMLTVSVRSRSTQAARAGRGGPATDGNFQCQWRKLHSSRVVALVFPHSRKYSSI